MRDSGVGAQVHEGCDNAGELLLMPGTDLTSARFEIEAPTPEGCECCSRP
jgi:hypothetical protein